MASCGASCGITRERERQKEAARALARAAFPEGDVTAPAWWPAEPPFAEAEVRAIAGALEGVLPCRAYVVPGDGGGADWVHLVATLAKGSWLALREGLGPAPRAASETSLRVGLSPLGRYATLQEVRLTGAREGGGWWVEEERVAGVEDRRLQAFVKAAQGFLRKRKVVALDAAFLTEGLPGGGAGDTLWAALFDRDPMETRTAVWVPVPEAPARVRA